jgi:hypothetical protein
MKTIWKYKLELKGVQSIEVPQRSRPLSLKVQDNEPCVWILVPDTETDKKETITFTTFGTGQPNINVDNWFFLDTYLLNDGLFVFHVFYKPNLY